MNKSEPESAQNIPGMLAPFIRPHRSALIFAVALNAFHGLAITFQNLMPKHLIDNVLLAEGLDAKWRWLRQDAGGGVRNDGGFAKSTWER